MSDSQTPSPATTPAQPRDVPVVRIRLGAERPAPQPDPLGRATIGHAAGLSPAQLWQRGRDVWKAKLTTVAEASSHSWSSTTSYA